MIHILDKSKCCGCAACIQRCPKQCITLNIDNEGFSYPVVDAALCIDCGLCEKVCPFLNPYDKREPQRTFAAYNTQEDVRMQSSSGGIFSLLAENVFNEGGVVFGARFDENWQVVIDYTESKEGLAAFRGSKYVQAKTGDTFRQCETFLKAGRKVLYTGTPCQVAGLKHFLQKDYVNLLTVDFVCHGVPSPKVWSLYLDEVVGLMNLKGVSMRDKRKGWKNFHFTVAYDSNNGGATLSSPHGKNDYMRAFLHDMILRPSCHNCQAKECRSNSDITIGDYWGINDVRPAMNDDKGIGLVLVHTCKGDKALKSEMLCCDETTYEEGYRSNPAIYQSVKPWFRRQIFFDNIDVSESVISLIRKCLRPPLIIRVKGLIRMAIHLPMRIYNVLKTNIKENQGGVSVTDDTDDDLYDSKMILKEVTFRDKSTGWSSYSLTIKFKDEGKRDVYIR